jgi:uncharacterized protein YjbI with pentapeptide repeats
MKLVKPMALSFTCRPLLLLGRQRFAVTSLVGFSLAKGPARLISEVELWPAIGKATTGLVDEGLPKSRGEALLFGSCHAPGGKPLTASSVRMQLGPIDKRLAVIGDRYWQDSAWKTPTTDPEPFTEMPLGWERAFGGPEYAKNPLGRGIAEDGGKVALPNVEPARGMLTARSERPEPAGFGPLDLGWPQRIQLAGTYDAAWLEKGFPGYARDTDPAFFSMAPVDQRIAGFFVGNETYTLENVHPSRPKITGVLPGVAARTFLRGRGKDFAEVKTRLETVVFLPGLEMGILVFRGTADIEEDDAADITHVFAACEDAATPRDGAHYRSAFERRIDKDESPLLALQEDDMLPAFAKGTGLDSFLEALDSKVDDGSGAVRADVEGKVREQLTKHGIDAEKALVKARAEAAAPPGMPSIARLDELAKIPALLAPGGLSALQTTLAAAAEETKAHGEKATADATARTASLPKREPAPAGPPKPQAPEVLATMERSGKNADPAMIAKLRELDEASMAAYRQTAHYQDAGEGNDLSGRSMAGEDLRGALLPNANLTRTDLTKANLEDALLAHGILSDTRFEGAKLARANLGSALVDGARFDGADLTKAVLARAKLASASFRDANLTAIDLLEAVLGAVDFEGATMPALSFLRGQDLSRCRFARARLHKANFLVVKLDGVDFSEAILELVTFVTVSANDASFRGADLTKVHAVSGCSFRNACFDGANLTRAFLRGADLRGASFVGANLTGADLSECNLTGAKLSRVSARGAKFVRADLTGADIQDSDLMEAMLQKSTLKGANLSRANLFSANLGQIRLDTGTQVKDANLKRALLLPKLGSSS